MSKAIPILQMVLTDEYRNQAVFSSELANDSSQSVLFCIPIKRNIVNNNELFEYLANREIYLPFYQKGDVYNRISKFDYPFLKFFDKKNSLSNEQFGPEFIIDFKKYSTKLIEHNSYKKVDKKNSKERYENDKMKYLIKSYVKIFKKLFGFSNREECSFRTVDYIGNWYRINKRKTKFLVLNLQNLNSIEYGYRKFNIAPVGLTPKFGYLINQDNNDAQQWL